MCFVEDGKFKENRAWLYRWLYEYDRLIAELHRFRCWFSSENVIHFYKRTIMTISDSFLYEEFFHKYSFYTISNFENICL